MPNIDQLTPHYQRAQALYNGPLTQFSDNNIPQIRWDQSRHYQSVAQFLCNFVGIYGSRWDRGLRGSTRWWNVSQGCRFKWNTEAIRLSPCHVCQQDCVLIQINTNFVLIKLKGWKSQWWAMTGRQLWLLPSRIYKVTLIYQPDHQLSLNDSNPDPLSTVKYLTCFLEDCQYDLLAKTGLVTVICLLTFFAWNSIAHKYMGKIPPHQILKINQ